VVGEVPEPSAANLVYLAVVLVMPRLIARKLRCRPRASVGQFGHRQPSRGNGIQPLAFGSAQGMILHAVRSTGE
jgi:hypothetical protein